MALPSICQPTSVNGRVGAVILSYSDVGAASTTDPRLGDQRTPLDGSVTNAKVATAAGIVRSKLNFGSGLVDSDIASGAGILRSKLNFGAGLVNADVATSAGLAYSKLNLGGSVINADIATAAAIARSKLDFGSGLVNADISSSAAIAESKLSLASDAAAATPSRRSLGLGASQAAAGNDSRFLAAATLTLAGKFYRDTYGTFDQAAVVSIIAGRSSAPTTQVMGTSDSSATTERGSVALVADATGVAPTVDSTSTTFTASSVIFGAGIDLSGVRAGQLVDAGGAEHVGGSTSAFVQSVVGQTVNITNAPTTGWRAAGAAAATPANGTRVRINRQNKIWGATLYARTNYTDATLRQSISAAGLEIDNESNYDYAALEFDTTHTGQHAWGLDVWNNPTPGGSGTHAFNARGKWFTGFASSGMYGTNAAHFRAHRNYEFTAATTALAAFYDDDANVLWSLSARKSASYTGFLRTLRDTDTNPRHTMDRDGLMQWGPGGVSALDASLYYVSGGFMRFGGNGVYSDGFIVLDQANTGARLYFGSGADASIYRGGASLVKTDVTLQALALRSATLQDVNGVARLLTLPAAGVGVRIAADAAGTLPLSVRGFASQSANLQEWQDSAGAILSRIDSTGNFSGGNIFNLAGAVRIQLNASNIGGLFTAPAGSIPIVSKGAASQSNDLQQWQSSAAAVLAQVLSTGDFQSTATISAQFGTANKVTFGWDGVGGAAAAGFSLGSSLDVAVKRNGSTTPTLAVQNPFSLKSYTLATRPAAGNVPNGTIVYVSDALAGANYQGVAGGAWVNLG